MTKFRGGQGQGERNNWVETEKKRGILYMLQRKWTNEKNTFKQLFQPFLRQITAAASAALTEGVLQVLLSHQFEVFLYGLCR